MNKIKMVLFFISFSFCTTIFLIEEIDEPEESFYESAWEEDLSKISAQGNWDSTTDMPTEKWINEAIQSAFEEMVNNEKLTVDDLSKAIRDKLENIYLNKNEMIGKKEIERKDLDKIDAVINKFKNSLKVRQELNKAAEYQQQQKVIFQQQQLFTKLLKQINDSGPNKAWQNKVIDQANILIERYKAKQQNVIQQINKEMNKYKSKLWFFQHWFQRFHFGKSIDAIQKYIVETIREKTS